MTTRANKDKGRRWQQKIRDDLLSRFPFLKKDVDIHSTHMGQAGCDIVLSDVASKYIPYSIEAKSHKSGFTPVLTALAQSKNNCKNNTTPVAVIKQDGNLPFVAMYYDDWLKLLESEETELNIVDTLRMIAHRLDK